MLKKKKNQWILCFLCGDITSHTGSPQSLPEGEIKSDSQPPGDLYRGCSLSYLCHGPWQCSKHENAISSIARCQDKAESHGAEGYKLWHGVWHTVGVSRIRLQDKDSLVTTCCIM